MGPGDLSAALAPLVRAHDPRLIVGHETFDDAGVFRLSDDLALVQTVDFFAPIVDDAYLFGQIAAANALSDVYAMGGTPLTALAIAGFPTGRLPLSVLSEILRGGQEKVHEAGAVIVGGHTVVDEEIKYGLAVTGQVHPQRILTNAGALVGDVLVLTKPLGTGVLTTAVKGGALPAATLDAPIDAMRTLNAAAARVAVDLGVRCATDVTGFGILGHASHIARASHVTLQLAPGTLPVFPQVRDAIAAKKGGTGGAKRNLSYLESLVDWGNVSDVDRALLVDPQTSGGLLVAVPADRTSEYLSRVPSAVAVGLVLPRGQHAIVLGG